MKKYYEITKHNSTLCGYPARNFDWDKLCWDRSHRIKEEHRYMWRGSKKGCMAYQVAHFGYRAPKVYKDNFLIAGNCEYLHVPYDWAESGTIYRVRPNESMYAGNIYWGKLIKSQSAIKRGKKWYWVLEI